MDLLILFRNLLISACRLGKWRTTAETYGLVHENCWVKNEWMTHFPVVPPRVRVAWLSLDLQHNVVWLLFIPPLIVRDDWKDDREGVTCNQEWFQRQEINLWQDLFLSSVSLENPGLSPQFKCVLWWYQTDGRASLCLNAQKINWILVF